MVRFGKVWYGKDIYFGKISKISKKFLFIFGMDRFGMDRFGMDRFGMDRFLPYRTLRS